MKICKSLLCASAILVLSACGDSDDVKDVIPPEIQSKSGILHDSPVINMNYKSGILTGVTDSKGAYKYLEGSKVTFSIGDLEFPEVDAKGVITPFDLANSTDINNQKVVNMLRLLQTLDKDGDPSNGITITDEAKNNAGIVNFDKSIEDFAANSEVKALIANAGQKVPVTALIPTDKAKKHFEDELHKLHEKPLPYFFGGTLEGDYYVTFAVPENGSKSTHSTYRFKKIDKTVEILKFGSTEPKYTAKWSINSTGQLIIVDDAGEFTDILTLSSGSQLSGKLKATFRGVETTGSIKFTPAFDESTLSGFYNITLQDKTLTTYEFHNNESDWQYVDISRLDSDGYFDVDFYKYNYNLDLGWSINKGGQLNILDDLYESEGDIIKDTFTLTSGSQQNGSFKKKSESGKTATGVIKLAVLPPLSFNKNTLKGSYEITFSDQTKVIYTFDNNDGVKIINDHHTLFARMFVSPQGQLIIENNEDEDNNDRYFNIFILTSGSQQDGAIKVRSKTGADKTGTIKFIPEVSYFDERTLRGPYYINLTPEEAEEEVLYRFLIVDGIREVHTYRNEHATGEWSIEECELKITTSVTEEIFKIASGNQSNGTITGTISYNGDNSEPVTGTIMVDSRDDEGEY